MKILYDNQVFTWQRFGGISRYCVELIKHLDADISYRLPIGVSNNEYLADGTVCTPRPFFPHTEFRGKARLMDAVNQTAFKCGARRPFDLLHPTYYDPRFLSSLGGKPFVVTVYDLIHKLYPEVFSPNDPTVANQTLLCQKAAKVIAISHNTKADLVRLMGVNPDKIEVIYLGQSFTPCAGYSMELPERYVLFTGQRAGYKNFERFARAFALLPADVSLVCTGKPFSAEEHALLAELHIASRVQVLYASDRQLTELYERAALFVFPSLYEGFGIPILEAFAAGCPIALSDSSSFPEVAGEGGGYFDPTDVDSIRQTMAKVLDDPSYAKQLVGKGKTQLAKFSWSEMGKQTSELYRQIV